MWKLWLAALAVAGAVFAGVVFLGLRTVDDEAEPPTPVPPREELTWAQRASAQCTNSLDTVRAALMTPGAGDESDARRSVRLFVETTAIEGRLVASLRAIPSPTDPAKVREAIGTLATQHEKDVRVGRQLQTRYDEQLLRKAVADYERVATRIRRLFRELGAAGCVSYFDPSSYG